MSVERVWSFEDRVKFYDMIAKYVDLGFKVLAIIITLYVTWLAFQEFAIKYNGDIPLELSVSLTDIPLDGKRGISVDVSLHNKGTKTISVVKARPEDKPDIDEEGNKIVGDDGKPASRFYQTGIEMTVLQYKPSMESAQILRYYNGDSSDTTEKVIGKERFQMLRGRKGYMHPDKIYTFTPNVVSHERAVIKAQEGFLYVVRVRFWGESYITTYDEAYIYIPTDSEQLK